MFFVYKVYEKNG